LQTAANGLMFQFEEEACGRIGDLLLQRIGVDLKPN